MPSDTVLSSSPGAILPRRPKLAIVSTYDELCGIAGYTRALERQLSIHADVTVFDLDQYLLRGQHKRIRALGDVHIAEIASQLHGFDSVNIQLEHGTLGRGPANVLRRIKVLVRAAPALSVTFHTILFDEPLPWERMSRHLLHGHFGSVFSSLSGNMRARIMSTGIYGLLRKTQDYKPLSVIVHTKRDMRLLRDIYRIRDVHHHPLSYVDAERASEVRASARRDAFPAIAALPKNAKLIGSFGFLSPYKGFETAIDAMHYLPEDHHLLIFGGIHPQTIKREQAVDPYIARLLKRARIGQNMLDHVKESGARVSPTGDAATLLGRHPEDLRDRVHFMGVLSDEQFLTAMALCDVVVLPYLEVGQSSSGPVSMGLDMGCRVIASRTPAFLQFARYHPGRLEFFDIGNFAELAERIRSPGPPDGVRPPLAYTTQTNAKIYLQANGMSSAVPAIVADPI
jgi:glycosyltransferase involved in cell wall biosynthesis